jgi:hypothetical protein
MARWDHSMTTYNGNEVYMCAGQNVHTNLKSCLHLVDPINVPSAKWTTDVADMPDTRRTQGMVAIDGTILVIGGCKTIGAVCDMMRTVFVYHPEMNVWTQGVDVPDAMASPVSTGVVVMPKTFF